MNDLNELFSRRLRVAFALRNTNQTALAKAIGTGEAVISRYCNGINLPSLPVLVSIAKFFGVTTDWLFGLTDDANMEV